MPKLAGSAGHNAHVTGAHGFITEHIENRKVLKYVDHYIEKLGWEFVDCTDDASRTAAAIVNGAIKKHNDNPDAESDIQLHFNASEGSHDRAIGVECIVSTKARAKDRERADRIADKLAAKLGLPRRKTIVTDKFGFPRETHYGIIVEICFVNSKADTNAYEKAGASNVGKWIAEAIANKEVEEKKPTPAKPTPAKPKPKPAKPSAPKSGVYRVKVNGDQVGAYGDVENILRQVEKAVEAGKSKIEVELKK